MRKFILDEEINLLKVDANNISRDFLNTSKYVTILKETIKNAPNNKSFTIGLFGEWGSGKSSIIKTAKEDLLKEEIAGHKVKMITYDAWKYANDSFRRTFLFQLQRELNFEQSDFMQMFYSNKTEDVKIKFNPNGRKILLAIFFLAILAIIINFTSIVPDNLKNVLTAIIPIIVFAYTVFKGMFDDLKIAVQKPHLFAPEQFEDCFDEIVEKSMKKYSFLEKGISYVKGEHHEKDIDQLIIVIDNIDRCQKELAYELLTNIKNFLGDDHSIIFIIPVDDLALKRFFVNSHKTDINCDKEADEFLRKFFNVTIRIKPFQSEEIYEFAKQISSKNNLQFQGDVLNLVSNEFASNPRRIIQFFNNLSAELECFDIEFSEKHQGVICKMLIIREEFPVFYNETIKSPEIIFKHYSSEKNKELDVFLNNTYAITMSLKNDISILERIISNSNVFDGISTTVKESIQRSDIEALKLYISENENSKNKVISYILSLLEKAIKRENYKIDVRNYFNILLALFENKILSNSDHKKIYDLIKADNVLDSIIENLDSYDSVIRFSKRLKESGLTNLVERVITTLNNLPPAKENEDGSLDVDKRDFSEKQLKGIYYACEQYNKNLVLKLKDAFTKAYKNDNESIFQNYDFGEKYNILFEKDTIKFIVEHVELSNSKDGWLDDFIFISEKQDYKSFTLAEYLNKAANEFPVYDYNENNSSDILPKLEQINFVLKRYSIGKHNYSNDDLLLIQNLLHSIGLNLSKETQTVVTRNYNSISVSKSFIKDNVEDENISRKVLKYFILSYKITDTFSFSELLINEIIKTESMRLYFNEYMVDIREKGWSIRPFYEIIIGDDYYIIDSSFILLKDVLFNDEIDEEQRRTKLEKILNLAIDDETSEECKAKFIHLIEDVIENEICKSSIAVTISQKSKDEILKLSKPIQTLAIDVFSDNQSDYESNIEVLKLIASNGNNNQIEKLVPLVNIMINDVLKRNYALSIILSFNKLSEEQINALKGSLKLFNKEEEFKDRIDECKKHLSKISK